MNVPCRKHRLLVGVAMAALFGGCFSTEPPPWLAPYVGPDALDVVAQPAEVPDGTDSSGGSVDGTTTQDSAVSDVVEEVMTDPDVAVDDTVIEEVMTDPDVAVDDTVIEEVISTPDAVDDGGATVGTDSCFVVGLCVLACEDDACVLSCKADGSAQGLETYEALESCREDNGCEPADPCEPCQAELAGCYFEEAGTDGSCAGLYDGFSACIESEICGDSEVDTAACVQTCLNQEASAGDITDQWQLALILQCWITQCDSAGL
ncbi:MAG: hypothetical protein QF464_14865, partial [Myxococcota bacterium]|nr:hypothetical protein [Myxococcota bacterium]